MAASFLKHLALDTNVLMDLAEGADFAHDFREAFQARGYSLLVPPTAVLELDLLQIHGDARQRKAAPVALGSMVGDWRLRPFEISSVAESVCEHFANLLIAQRLLPASELSDGLILAETAWKRIPGLVTSDKHLLNIDEMALRLVFDGADLDFVYVTGPRRLLRALH